VIEWGDGIYGCQAAARRYYGKPASDLEPAEAAGLAAMIPNPRRINPVVDARRHARAQRRVLWLMANAGYIGREVSGLGTEPPPPEPVEEEHEDDEPAPVEPPPATAEPEPTPTPGVR
jgi:monofunctional biosynthetic peptidoglycan transglycosylase